MIYYSYMHTGMILLVWMVAAVILVVGMVASGMLTIKIEKVDPEEKDRDEEAEE